MNRLEVLVLVKFRILNTLAGSRNLIYFLIVVPDEAVIGLNREVAC